ncbi:Hypothetical predicted protein [Mytilus galloprovincialis]|uniref:EGF-like domain-containing protein n=1 Tax=Mytilus galloprovincialis TaxID=29158 RepID=A0A8B6GJ64_MYTGA|nr:Hypothetical predicted protein [Mytilus galloprovincialis]
MDCLQGCGIPLSWWKTNATEERACGKCKHHGVFNTTLNRCICKSGYGGKCCNDIDNCADEPCEYGVCADKVNDFSCDCMAFFKGKMCNKMEAWAIALLSLAALAVLLTCCCCFWCIMGTCDRDDEKRKVRPLKEKPRQNPKKDLLVTIGYKGPSSSTHNKRTM